jgi:hypothetical protein
MNTSNRDPLPRQPSANAAVEPPKERAATPVRHAKERTKRLPAIHLRSTRLRAAAQEAHHIHQLEQTGESEWTPWIAIAGLILCFAAAGLLVFGIVEGVSHLLASTALQR